MLRIISTDLGNNKSLRVFAHTAPDFGNDLIRNRNSGIIIEDLTALRMETDVKCTVIVKMIEEHMHGSLNHLMYLCAIHINEFLPA